MNNGAPERKGFRATIVTGDRNVFYANFKASDKPDAYEEFVNILLGLDFLICEDETAIRTSDVVRFTVDLIPTPEEILKKSEKQANEDKTYIKRLLREERVEYEIETLLWMHKEMKKGNYVGSEHCQEVTKVFHDQLENIVNYEILLEEFKKEEK